MVRERSRAKFSVDVDRLGVVGAELYPIGTIIGNKGGKQGHQFYCPVLYLFHWLQLNLGYNLKLFFVCELHNKSRL